MRIGVFVHSITGHTRHVAERVSRCLADAGHRVDTVPLETAEIPLKGEASPPIASRPDMGTFDAVILASHVEAFGLCPAMRQYMRTLGGLDGKPMGLILTQQFPWKWMGGRAGLRAMGNLCDAAGGIVKAGGSVNWSSKEREAQIAGIVRDFAAAF